MSEIQIADLLFLHTFRIKINMALNFSLLWVNEAISCFLGLYFNLNWHLTIGCLTEDYKKVIAEAPIKRSVLKDNITFFS